MTIWMTQVVFLSIAGVMLAIWAAGTRFAFRRLHTDVAPLDISSPEVLSDVDLIRGEAELAGDRETLSRKLAERLASSGEGVFKLVRRDAEGVAFEMLGPLGVSGEVALVQDGPRVRARYSLQMGRFNRLMGLIAKLVCFVYGGLFVVGVPALVWLLVVHNPDERIRWQVLQTFQMVHGVWPPFLVGHLVGRMRNAVVALLRTALSSLAFTG